MSPVAGLPRSDRYDGDPSINQLERSIEGLDDVVEMALEAARKKIGEPSCGSCSRPGCCHQYVLLTLAEALPIARRLIHDEFDSPGVRRHLERVGGEMLRASHEEWWARSQPCIFLKEGRCSIYDVRPVMCRAHFSWSNPLLCQPPTVEEVKTVDMVGVKRAVLQLNRELCHDIGLNDVLIYASAMPRMLAVALEVLSRDTDRAVEYLWTQEFPTVEKLVNFEKGEPLI